MPEETWFKGEAERMLLIEAALKIVEYCKEIEKAAHRIADFNETEKLKNLDYWDDELSVEERDEAVVAGELEYKETLGRCWRMYGLGDGSEPPGLRASSCGNERTVAEAAQALFDAISKAQDAGCLSLVEKRNKATTIWRLLLDPSFARKIGNV